MSTDRTVLIYAVASLLNLACACFNLSWWIGRWKDWKMLFFSMANALAFVLILTVKVMPNI